MQPDGGPLSLALQGRQQALFGSVAHACVARAMWKAVLLACRICDPIQLNPPSMVEQSFSSESMMTETSELARRKSLRCWRTTSSCPWISAFVPFSTTFSGGAGSTRNRYQASSDAS